MMYYYTYQTLLGALSFCEKEGALVAIDTDCPQRAGEKKETELIRKAYVQLTEYFEGRRQTFDLPLAPEGTAFQQRVWQALQAIPYGQTRTYKQIAEAVGNVKAVRAVGMANNRNPLLVVIPCHRVIGSDGKLVGYASGIEKKEWLLRLEGSLI